MPATRDLAPSRPPRRSRCRLERAKVIVRVNFQPAHAPVPAGFVVDSGQVYGGRGNGYTYGWSVDNTANMVDVGYDVDILAQRHARMRQGAANNKLNVIRIRQR